MFLASMLSLATAMAAPAMTPDAQTVVLAMFDAVNRHDAAAIARLYADDARLSSSDFCRDRVGRVEVERTYRALFASFPDIRDELESMVVQGDRVAVRFVARSAKGVPPLALPILTFLTVRQGLIRTDESSFDTGGHPCEL